MERSTGELEYLLNSLVFNSIKADRLKNLEDFKTSKLHQSTYRKLMGKINGIKYRIIKIYKLYTI